MPLLLVRGRVSVVPFLAVVAAAAVLEVLVVAFPLAVAAAALAVPGLLQPKPPACVVFPLTQFEMPPMSIPVARAASPWVSNRLIVLSVARSYCSTGMPT